jgi:chromate reductase
MRVSALCGSLRSGSFNQALLDTAAERGAEHGLEIVQASIREFPLFNQDREAEPLPPVVEAKRIIQDSACLLLATPEHNFGVPGVLKNAIDWLSRPKGDPTLDHRRLALMGASTGYLGTMRAQLAWRQMWHYFHAPVFSDAEMTLSFAAQKVRDGRVVDQQALEMLDHYLAAFAAWLDRCV